MRLAIVCVICLLPASALAESAVALCQPGELYPRTNHVPANVEGFVYRSDYARAPEQELSLTRYRDLGATSESVELMLVPAPDSRYNDWHVFPVGGLEEGWTYVFEDASCPDTGLQETTYFVDRFVALPETLGVTRVSGVMRSRPNPYGPLRDYVVVRLEPSPGVEGLETFMQLRLVVDGSTSAQREPGRSQSWTSPDTLSVRCGLTTRGLAEGPHEVRHVARHLVSTEADLSTPLVEMNVRCDEAVRVRYGTNEPLTAREIADEDRLPDGTFAPPEGAPRPTPPASGMSGGGCRAAPGNAGGGLALVLLLGLALVGRRRR